MMVLLRCVHIVWCPQRFSDLVEVSGLAEVQPKTLLRTLFACIGDAVAADGGMSAESFGKALTGLFSMDTLRKHFSTYSDHTVGSALMTIYDAFGMQGGEVRVLARIFRCGVCSACCV